jgi:hypothetical protein
MINDVVQARRCAVVITSTPVARDAAGGDAVAHLLVGSADAGQAVDARGLQRGQVLPIERARTEPEHLLRREAVNACPATGAIAFVSST